MSLKTQHFYDFGSFRLNPPERVLLRDGSPVPLPPKAFDLLVVLVEHAGRLVTKEDLLKEVWPGTFVEEANLSYTVSLLRKALGDDGEPHRFIETVAKRGYRFREIAEVGGQEEPAVGSHARRSVPWLLGAVGLLLLVALASWLLVQRREADAPPMLARLAKMPPSGVTVENAQISPNGRRIAFIGREADATRSWIQSSRLWVQSIDSDTATALPGTEGAVNPFWAPDSQHVAFNVGGSVQGALKKINVSGGPAQTLCQAVNAAGTWSRAGVIVYHAVTRGLRLPLSRVSDSGGTPAPATKLDSSRGELGHSWPHFLPDGRHFLYVVHSAEKKWSGLYVGSLDSTDVKKRLLDAETAAIYRPPGYLIFSRDGAIVAQPFDLTRLELTGEATPIAHDAEYQARLGPPQFSTSVRGFGLWGTITLFGAAIFSASETEVLAYSLFEPYQYQFGWFDRNGNPLGDLGSPATFNTFELSPDGKRLVVSRPRVDRANIWLFDVDRNAPSPSQISFGTALEFDPRWGPDGRRVASTSFREDGIPRIVEIGLDGKETVVLDQPAFVDDWSRDGRYLLWRRPGLGQELMVLPLFGERTPIPVRRRPSAGGIDQARFSRDGRLIAYSSNESGKWEVYIEPFPPTGEPRNRLSLAGGVQPMWRSDGKELYYLGLDGTLFAVEIRGTDVKAGIPRPLFKAPVGPRRHDVEQYATVDGTRFLILKPIVRHPRPIDVVINWPAAIKHP